MSNIQYFSLKETLAVSNINTKDKQKVEFENTDNDDKGVLYFICNDEELDEVKMQQIQFMGPFTLYLAYF